jgi:hypothetical protein
MTERVTTVGTHALAFAGFAPLTVLRPRSLGDSSRSCADEQAFESPASLFTMGVEVQRLALAGMDSLLCAAQRRRPTMATVDLSAPEGAPEGIRTPNLLIRRHGPTTRTGKTRVQLPRMWRCRGARLSSSLSSELSSAHGAKQRHPRFLTHPQPHTRQPVTMQFPPVS